MRTTKQYKSGFTETFNLPNLNSEFAGSDLQNVEYSNLRTQRQEFSNLRTQRQEFSNLRTQKQDVAIRDYKNIYGEDLDNDLYNNADGSLTPAEVQEIYRAQGGTMAFQDWLKTDASKQALAYALQLKNNPQGKLSSKVIKKLYKESGSKLPLTEWVKTDAAKGAMAAYAHKESGSKQTFGDWLQTDTAKSILASATLLTALAVANAGAADSTIGAGRTESPNTPIDENKNTETTILGMSPVTFSIVSIVVIGGAIFGIKKLSK